MLSSMVGTGIADGADFPLLSIDEGTVVVTLAVVNATREQISASVHPSGRGGHAGA